jgi:hypothetical protein
MTEIDTWKIYREQLDRDSCLALQVSDGLITYYFTDGSTEVWQKNFFGKLKIVQPRKIKDTGEVKKN